MLTVTKDESKEEENGEKEQKEAKNSKTQGDSNEKEENEITGDCYCSLLLSLFLCMFRVLLFLHLLKLVLRDFGS